MKKTLASLMLSELILSATKKNDALENNFLNTTSPTNQVALLLQGQCLPPNGYLVSSGGAYKLILTLNGNLIQQVFIILFYFIKPLLKFD